MNLCQGGGKGSFWGWGWVGSLLDWIELFFYGDYIYFQRWKQKEEDRHISIIDHNTSRTFPIKQL